MSYNIHKTHNLFFSVLSYNRIQELYRRADPRNHILQDDINDILEKHPTIKHAKCNVNIINCHIFINITINKKQIGHISLHIESEDKSLSEIAKNRGRFHIKDNISSNKNYYTMLFRENKINSDKLYISYNTQRYMRPVLKEIVDIIVEILNGYFNPDSDSSLKVYDNTYRIYCYNKIQNKTYRKNHIKNIDTKYSVKTGRRLKRTYRNPHIITKK